MMRRASGRALHRHLSRQTALLKRVIGKENDPCAFTPLDVARALTNVKEETREERMTPLSLGSHKKGDVGEALNFKVSLLTG